MNRPRAIEPEWLDRLPADDPRAVRSRSDLRVINGWMRQPGMMARALMKYWDATMPRTLIDLGAGDGTFMLRVARRLAPRRPDVTVVLLDQQSIVNAQTGAEFRKLRWQVEIVRADVLDFLGRLDTPAVMATNLFLHHFEAEALQRLLAEIARSAALLVACEPRRARSALLASHLVRAIGCSEITRQDAVTSVRAGFTGNELSRLWPEPHRWELHEGFSFPFTHGFVARRLSERNA